MATRFHVPPLDMQDEILELLGRPHHAARVARADQQPVANAPGLLGCVHIDPAGQVLAIKKVTKRGWFLGGGEDDPRKEQGDAGKKREGMVLHGGDSLV